MRNTGICVRNSRALVGIQGGRCAVRSDLTIVSGTVYKLQGKMRYSLEHTRTIRA
jgi:hypothetical protein